VAAMLNAEMVNAEPRCVFRAHFGDFFRVSGRFPRFKNPVKYIRTCGINRDTVHFAAFAMGVKYNFCFHG
jgi:hypothetical protein